MKKISTAAGERFGKLVAAKRGEDYAFPNGKKLAERWIYKCDCGAEVLERPAQIRYNARTGIAACKECYLKWRASGGEFNVSANKLGHVDERSTEVTVSLEHDDPETH